MNIFTISDRNGTKKFQLLKDVQSFSIIKIMSSRGDHEKTLLCIPIFNYDDDEVQVIAYSNGHPLLLALLSIENASKYEITISVRVVPSTVTNPYRVEFDETLKERELPKGIIVPSDEEINELVTNWHKALGWRF